MSGDTSRPAAEGPAADGSASDPQPAHDHVADQPIIDAAADDDEPDAALAALERVRATGRPARTKRRSPARPPRDGGRDPVPLGDLIGSFAAARAWSAELEVGAIVGRWAEIVGPDVAEHCRPESFEEGQLTLRTDSTSWAYQLRLLTPQLMTRLRDEIGPDVITEIVVLGPVAPSWQHGLRSVPGRGPRDTYG